MTFCVKIMQKIIAVTAHLMMRTMRTSGSESFATAANVFEVGIQRKTSSTADAAESIWLDSSSTQVTNCTHRSLREVHQLTQQSTSHQKCGRWLTHHWLDSGVILWRRQHNDYQNLHIFTDGLNAGAYIAEGIKLPIMAGELTHGAITWTRANLAAEHKSRPQSETSPQ